MGYNSRLTGQINIDPPLTFAELSEVAPSINSRGLFHFDILEEEIETDEGILTKQSSSKIVVSNDDELRAYDAEQELRDLVTAVACFGRKFTGSILVRGDENGDIWRLRVVDFDKVIREDAKVVWPDGEKVQL